MARDIFVPDPLDSDRQFERFYHYDLAGMEIEDLLDELYAIRSRLWLLKSDRFRYLLGPFEQGRRIKWFRERISRIEAQVRKWRYTTRGVRSQPKLAEGVTL